MIKGITAGSLT